MTTTDRPITQLGLTSRDHVPYITPWSNERPLQTPLVLADGEGIAYLDETLHCRDIHGVLWSANTLSRGVGRPNYRGVHPQRQRRCMGGLLCQICALPADETEQGVLWLLETAGLSQPLPAEGDRTPQPPVCRLDAARAIRLCPPLRRGHILMRVKSPVMAGVFGQIYRPGAPLLPPGSRYLLPDGSGQFVSYEDPRARWTLAGQLVAELHGITPVTGGEYADIMRSGRSRPADLREGQR